jgi:CubicO group peptidase (beta-lactamase class C family)
MKDTRYQPGENVKDRAAATEFRKSHDKFMVGEVHDENAHEMGGIAGHAGLFSTASDLGIYCQTILNMGIYGTTRVLSRAAVGTSMQLHTPPGEAPRGLGWLKRPKEQCSAGDMLSCDVIYHTGFTGTLIVIDPRNDLFIVLLTNRVHPTRDNDSIFRIRPRFCNAVAGAIEDWGQG